GFWWLPLSGFPPRGRRLRDRSCLFPLVAALERGRHPYGNQHAANIQNFWKARLALSLQPGLRLRRLLLPQPHRYAKKEKQTPCQDERPEDRQRGRRADFPRDSSGH